MSEFNFKSAICTSRKQSEKLLALGLNKETADMVHSTIVVLDNLVDLISEHPWTARQEVTDNWYPAWSLHRLLCLYGQDYEIKELYNNAEECYGMLICAIERAIEDGDFNEEYLEKQWE